MMFSPADFILSPYSRGSVYSVLWW